MPGSLDDKKTRILFTFNAEQTAFYFPDGNKFIAPWRP